MKQLSLFAMAALAFSSALAISPNLMEAELGRLIQSHASQKRTEMIHDPLLNAVARAKALDLGGCSYFEHVDPDGFGPNRVVQLVGYDLPDWYGTEQNSNYIESLGAGATSASQMLTTWLKSADHREHVLGTDPFYAAQTHHGVGYAAVSGSPHRRYFVFISAPPPSSMPSNGVYGEWLLQWFSPKTLEGTDDLSDHDGDGILRLLEFVLGFEPYTPEALPSPVLSHDSARLEWHLPLRQELGAIKLRVERSIDLKSWTPEGVERNSNGSFSIPIDHRGGFLRLLTER